MMLGRTAGGLFWMFRYLERSDSLVRMINAALNMALIPTTDTEVVWRSVLTTTGQEALFVDRHESFEPIEVVNFLLREPAHNQSLRAMIEQARNNGREMRTAITRETWEAMNDCWLMVDDVLSDEVTMREVPEVIRLMTRQSALVYGAQQATMMRDNTNSFCRLGKSIERALSTARLLDVKNFVLLSSASDVGSPTDSLQWETLLRSVSAYDSYMRLHKGKVSAASIVDFLVLDDRMPRSLAYSTARIVDALGYLDRRHEEQIDANKLATEMFDVVDEATVDSIMDFGLHQFLSRFIADTGRVANQIEKDFRFYE